MHREGALNISAAQSWSLKISRETLILYSFLLSGVTFGVADLDSFPWHVLTILLLYKGKVKSLDYSIFLTVGIGC